VVHHIHTEHPLVGNPLVEGDHKEACHQHMGLEHTRDGKGPQSDLGQVGNHQQGLELGEGSGSDHDRRHSNHDEVGFCHDSHLDEDCIHGMDHGDHSHHPHIHQLGVEEEIGIALGHGGYQVESMSD
jgi:hypothetical protein